MCDTGGGKPDRPRIVVGSEHYVIREHTSMHPEKSAPRLVLVRELVQSPSMLSRPSVYSHN